MGLKRSNMIYNKRGREEGGREEIVCGRKLEMKKRVCGGGWRLKALKYFLSQKRDLLTDMSHLRDLLTDIVSQ